jgi:DNA polymerase-3 subunit gamma/tau
MSTTVLARKYRPRRFGEMVGQAHVVQALTNALQQGRLHHAYLFTGTRGIGKTTVSRILAKSLNCTGPDGTGGITAEPCGVCTACTEIDADRYIDYIELDAASNRGIDEIRDLLERAAYKPSVGRFKVFMIDEAHQLTKESFNALLKTLEEPPEYLKFVLATTDPEKMLPTVLSRCLQFNLRPMAPEVVQEHLQQVLQAEGVEHDATGLRLLSRAARGSMRDALSLTDQAIAYGGGRFDEAVVRGMLGAVDDRQSDRLIAALAARDGAGLLQHIDALRQAGQSATGTLDAMARRLQQMAVEQAVPDSAQAAGLDEAASVAELAASLAADETQLLYSMVLHGRGEIGLMSDEHGTLTMVLLRFLAFAPAGGGSAARPPPPTPTPVAARAPAALVTAEPPAPPMTRPVGREAATPPVPLRAPVPVASARLMPPPRGEPTPRPTAKATPTDEVPPWLDAPPFDAEDDAPVPARPVEPPAEAAAAPAAVARPAPPVAPSVERTPLGDRWAEATTQLQARGAIAAMVRELALQSQLMAVEADAEGRPLWRLQVERESLRQATHRDKLQAALQALLDQPVQLQVDAGPTQDTPARRDAEARQRRQRAAERAVQEDPVVRELMAQFATARIVPGSIKPLP